MENKASKVCRIVKSAGLLLTLGIWKPNITVSFLMGFLADLWEYCLFPTVSQKQLLLCQASCTVWFGIRIQGMFQRRSRFAWSPLADWRRCESADAHCSALLFLRTAAQWNNCGSLKITGGMAQLQMLSQTSGRSDRKEHTITRLWLLLVNSHPCLIPQTIPGS